VVLQIRQAEMPYGQKSADRTPLAPLESGWESYNKCKFHTTE